MSGFKIQSQWMREWHRNIPAFTIPWDLIAPHEEQALRNHAGQNLETLNRRGGLGYCEAVAVLEDRDYHPMDQPAALKQLREMADLPEIEPSSPPPSL